MAGAIIDKHKRLNDLPSPKLILIGGSNVMFGFNSPYMEQELKMPVQNMALAASLGLSFMLNEVKEDIKKGDVVLLSIEYFLNEGDDNIKLFLAELYPPAKKYIEFPNVLEDLKANCKYIFRELRKYLLLKVLSNDNHIDDVAYSRKAFNKNGNIREELRLVSHLPLNDGGPIARKSYSESITKINKFVELMESKGAKVYFVFPCLAESQYKLSPEAIEDLHQQYKKSLKTKIINSPIDSVYPDSCFYDTIYHLRSPYHTVHTKKVIKDLEQYLE
ncbi:hypothetical protein [Emticicia aquatilis]|nr:hypothetical protein [Emticicia aquatilis]